jgi:type II secretory pathway pseudopilin PulG
VRRAAFTLIEVLLAMSLTAAVGLAIAQVLAVSTKAQTTARERATTRALGQALWERLDGDLRAVVPPGGVYAAGLVGEQSLDSAVSLLPSDVEREALEQDPAPPVDARDRLTLAVLPPATSFGEELAAGEGSLWQVTYEIDDDPSTEISGLVRTAQRVRDLPPTVAAPEPEVLADYVVGFEVRYYDGLDWVEVWDSSTSEILPQSIRLRLAVLEGEDVSTLVFEISPWSGLATQLPEAVE